MRETFTAGSVGRAPGNRCLYPEPDCLQRPVRRSSACSIPIVDGKDAEEYPWVSGFPEPERARGHEPAGKAESGEKTRKPRLGETRVTWRTLDGLQSNPMRAMEGLWRQRLSAGGTLRQDKRTACAPSASPAPRHEGGEGMRGPPPSRSNVRCGGTAGWPPGREPSGHGAAGGVGGRDSRLQGALSPMAQGSRLPCKEGVRVGGIPRACPCLSMGTGEPDTSNVVCPVRGGTGRKGSHDLARGLPYLMPRCG